jgi:hypothetical protein
MAAPGGRAAPIYAYRVRGAARSGVVLWLGAADGPDRVLTLPPSDGRARSVPVFATVRQARTYAARRGRRLADPSANTLELARAQHWLADPAHRCIPAAPVLDAWNFFEDLAHSLDARPALPDQGPTHDSAYDKLFAGECTTWTPAELNAVTTLLAAGLTLWETCPLTLKPRAPRSLRGHAEK